VGNDRQFARFCELAGRPDLATDERFATNAARVHSREVLIPIVRDLMVGRSSQAWLEVLEQAGIPSGPIDTLDKVFENPQLRHREMRVELPHPLAGTVPLVASPLRLSASPVQYRQPPPTLGQHTDEVLKELLGLQDADIQALRAEGTI
jgi:crotonobetainyl-CoA:carnitine CoA-transferase CaiB-like acyl-CoA transferase